MINRKVGSNGLTVFLKRIIKHNCQYKQFAQRHRRLGNLQWYLERRYNRVLVSSNAITHCRSPSVIPATLDVHFLIKFLETPVLSLYTFNQASIVEVPGDMNPKFLHVFITTRQFIVQWQTHLFLVCRRSFPMETLHCGKRFYKWWSVIQEKIEQI